MKQQIQTVSETPQWLSNGNDTGFALEKLLETYNEYFRELSNTREEKSNREDEDARMLPKEFRARLLNIYHKKMVQ